MGKVKSSSDSFDDWAAAEAGKKCPACQPPYRETISAMLEAIIRHRSKKGRREVYEKLREVHPDFPGTNRSLENHLYEHERERWAKARGRS